MKDKGMYNSRPACVNNKHMRPELSGHKMAGNNLSLEAHQMVGGFKASKPMQGMVPNKVQEDRKPKVCNHAEPVKVSMSDYVGKNNKIC